MEEEERAAAADKEQKQRELMKKNLMHRLDVQTQMVAKAHIRAAEEDEKLRALEIAQAVS